MGATLCRSLFAPVLALMGFDLALSLFGDGEQDRVGGITIGKSHLLLFIVYFEAEIEPPMKIALRGSWHQSLISRDS